MKEKLLKIFGYSVSLVIIIVVVYSVIYSVFYAFQKIFSTKIISQEFEKIAQEIEKSAKEFQQKIQPSIELPEIGLKINVKGEIATTTPLFFSLNLLINENDLYWRIESAETPQDKLKILRFVFPLIQFWEKIQIEERNIEELKKIKEVLHTKWIFKNFKLDKDKLEFSIDKEKFKNALLKDKERPKEEKQGIKEILIDFVDGFKEISLKLYLEEKLVKKAEVFGEGLEGEKVKLIFEFENLKEEMVKNKEKENFESVLISTLSF